MLIHLESMNKKGLVVIGPTLLFVNVFALLISGLKMLFAFGLVSGIIFRKKLKSEEKWVFMLKFFIILVLIVSTILLVRILFGGYGNHFVHMFIGAPFFLIILFMLSFKDLKEKTRETIITSLLITLLYITVSELSVFLTLL